MIGGAGEPAGPVIVSAPEVLCAYRLPQVIRQLHHQLPGIRLLFRANPTGALDSNLRRALASGDVDAAFVPGEDLASTGSRNVEYLTREPLVIVAAPAAPAGSSVGRRAHRPRWRAGPADRQRMRLPPRPRTRAEQRRRSRSAPTSSPTSSAGSHQPTPRCAKRPTGPSPTDRPDNGVSGSGQRPAVCVAVGEYRAGERIEKVTPEPPAPRRAAFPVTNTLDLSGVDLDFPVSAASDVADASVSWCCEVSPDARLEADCIRGGGRRACPAGLLSARCRGGHHNWIQCALRLEPGRAGRDLAWRGAWGGGFGLVRSGLWVPRLARPYCPEGPWRSRDRPGPLRLAQLGLVSDQGQCAAGAWAVSSAAGRVTHRVVPRPLLPGRGFAGGAALPASPGSSRRSSRSRRPAGTARAR